MPYKYIKGCINIIPTFSFAPSLWYHEETGDYYLSDEYMDIIKPKIDTSYMLLHEEKPPKYNPYKQNLSQKARKLTASEINSGIGHFGNGSYKLK